MLSRLLTVAMLLAASLASRPALPQEKPDGASQVLAIDPTTRPVLGPKKAKGPRYIIWHADGEWHLRTRSGTDLHTFRGTITAIDGKVLQVSSFENLEGKGGKKSPDRGKLNDVKDRIAFEFRTGTGEDGFDFKLDGDVTALEFDLKIDEKPAFETVYLGKKAANPPKGKFRLAAAPKTGKAP
jgi:hypothetical protein